MHDHLTLLFARLHAACLHHLDRLEHPSPDARLRSDRGQATTEYALVLLAAARRRPARRRLGHRWRRRGQDRTTLRPCDRLRDRSGLSDAGQATVEFALCLPLVVVLVLGLVQVALVARDQLAIELAAVKGHVRPRCRHRRRRPRAPPSIERSRSVRSASTSSSARSTVTVTVSYVNRTDVAIVGRAIGDAELRASVTMALEPP